MDDRELRRVHVRVTGRVQGVYYRQSTQREALARRLTGWVRNLPDGRVELVAEGHPGQVAELVQWLQRGPAAARVEEVEISEVAPTGGTAPFEVRR